MDTRELMTVAEMADAMRLAESTIWRWIREGKITSYRITSHCRRIPAAEVRRLMEEAEHAR